MFATPILFLVFNRLDTTKQVFEQVRLIKPIRLYIAADGPRENVPEDFAKCESIKQFLNNAIDWDCEVKTLYREVNLGCGIAVSQAITWFFQNEEMGIILEDDCLPAPSFFRFCEDLLVHYKNDANVMHISGSCHFQEKLVKSDDSYYFSNYMLCWGWASWSRAWIKNDTFLSNSQEIKQGLRNSKIRSEEKKYWLLELRHFQKIALSGNLHTWDTQWSLAILSNFGKCIIPNVNLVKNVGIGHDATNTLIFEVDLQDYLGEITLPIKHPLNRSVNELNDTYLYSHLYKKWKRKSAIEKLNDQAVYYFFRLKTIFSFNGKV